MKSIILILSFFWLLYSGLQDSKNKGKNEDESVASTSFIVQDTLRYVYVGAEACASECHNNGELGHQFDSWKESRHSKAWESLSAVKAFVYSRDAGSTMIPQENAVCLKCHVTAAGFDSSSLGAAYKREDGITCESCHKGEFNPRTVLPKEEECLKCHNNSVHSVPSFDFIEGCRKISHPRPENKDV